MVLVLLLLAILATAAFAQDRLDPAVPNPKLTPGVVADTDQSVVCGVVGGKTYSKRHRQTSAELKAKVRAEYHQRRCGEIDHRLPLALGGADALGNLWCQPAAPAPWTYKVKDKLEEHVWEAVCKRHTMTLQQGQAVFLAPDWRVEYRKVLGAP